MRIFVSTVLLLCSAGVYAFGDIVDEGNKQQQGQGQGQAQGQLQGQLQGQAQGQGQGQAQGQGIFHSGNAHQGQGQLQGNVGVNKAVGQGNTTTITSSGTIEAEPAIAPAIAPGDPTAPCYVTLGGSAAGGGVASIGFSGYKYDTICGAMEFYRVVGNDPAHADQAHKAVKVAYHNLMNRMWDEMGETEYTKATGNTVEDAGTTASYSYPTQDGGFMKVSFEKLNQVGMDAEEVKAERDITEPLR